MGKRGGGGGVKWKEVEEIGARVREIMPVVSRFDFFSARWVIKPRKLERF